MMRGQGIMKIEAAEVTLTTSTTRYQEWRSWQPGHRMPHEGAALESSWHSDSSVRRQRRHFMSEMVRARNCL